MAYRVDNVPALWRPFWLAYSWLVGVGFWCAWNLLVLTCQIRIEDLDRLLDDICAIRSALSPR